jgi:hypothetical protein
LFLFLLLFSYFYYKYACQGDTYKRVLIDLAPFNGSYSDDGRGEHVFLTRVGRLADVFLTRKIHADVLQQKPSKLLLQDTKRLLALERAYLLSLNEPGGIVDQMTADFNMLLTRMELYRVSVPSIGHDSVWVEGLAHLKTLIGRVGELRVIPRATITCACCGGLYPPAVEGEEASKLCEPCFQDKSNLSEKQDVHVACPAVVEKSRPSLNADGEDAHALSSAQSVFQSPKAVCSLKAVNLLPKLKKTKRGTRVGRVFQDRRKQRTCSL